MKNTKYVFNSEVDECDLKRRCTLIKYVVAQVVIQHSGNDIDCAIAEKRRVLLVAMNSWIFLHCRSVCGQRMNG